MKYYTSIRIPLINRQMGKHEDEFEIFENLRNLNNGTITYRKFIYYLKKYYNLYNKYHNDKLYKVNEKRMKFLLDDKPWNKCKCNICKKYGIHVCVFRRRMRNTLRAFHNVYNYYCFLKNSRTSKIDSLNTRTLTDFTGD